MGFLPVILMGAYHCRYITSLVVRTSLHIVIVHRYRYIYLACCRIVPACCMQCSYTHACICIFLWSQQRFSVQATSAVTHHHKKKANKSLTRLLEPKFEVRGSRFIFIFLNPNPEKSLFARNFLANFLRFHQKGGANLPG